ncbi:unnamed protein product [Rotaria magnacalcarata]
MWSGQLFLVWCFTLTILATQSHVIHKRGLLSKLFGNKGSSTSNVESDLPPRERAKLNELLKNPIVVSMLTAAVGMVIQQALAAKNMNDVCENKYIKMASSVGNFNPQLQQAINLLGCNGPNRKFDEDNENEEPSNDQDEEKETEDTLESGIPPEQHSKLQQLMSVARGEKGAKRNFLKGLFGLSSKDKTFKKGHKLPSSSYKLDKDDADAMKDLEKDLEKFNKAI